MLEVVADQANIRLEPDISSIIIRQVPKGTILTATEKREEWFAVQLAPKQGTVVSGFVHESLVMTIEPLPKDETPQVKPKIRPIEPLEQPKTSKLGYCISIAGGGNYIYGGEFNRGIGGLADWTGDLLGIQGKGNIDPVHSGFIIGIEASFTISPTLSWGFGTEYFQGKNESRTEYAQGADISSLIVRPSLRATPLSVFLSFNPVPEFYIKGGVSYYFAGCTYTYLFQTDDSTEQRKGRARAQGLGLTGGIGYLKSLSPNLSLVAEITGRLAKIQGFTGKEEFQDSSGEVVTEKGKLYLIQAQVHPGRTHPVLFIRETRPNEAGFIGAEKAQIDFSGLSLKVGLRLHF